jgi:hypothetical protein
MAERVQTPKVHEMRLKLTFQLSLTDLLTTMNFLRQEIISRGQSVTYGGLLLSIYDYYKVRDFSELGVYDQGGRKLVMPWEFIPLADLQKRELTLRTAIEASKSIRCISTLKDVEEDLCAIFEVKDFSKLELGPLLRHPSITKIFSPPASLEAIPSITFDQVVDHLRTYRVPKGTKIDPEIFKKHVASQLKIEDPAELCLHVSNWAIPKIFTIFGQLRREENKRFQAYTNERTKVTEDHKKKLALVVESQKKVLAKFYEEKDQDYMHRVRSFVHDWQNPKVVSLTRAEAVEVLLRSVGIILPDRNATQRKKGASTVNKFLETIAVVAIEYVRDSRSSEVSSTQTSRRELELKTYTAFEVLKNSPGESKRVLSSPVLLLASLCRSVERLASVRGFRELGFGDFLVFLEESKELTQEISSYFVSSIGEGRSSVEKEIKKAKRPAVVISDDIVRAMAEVHDYSSAEGQSPLSLLLARLSQMEAHVIQKFQVDNFESLGHGSFVDFLGAHQHQNLLEVPSLLQKSELLEFLLLCARDQSRISPKSLDKCFEVQFGPALGLRSVGQAGYGHVDTLLSGEGLAIAGSEAKTVVPLGSLIYDSFLSDEGNDEDSEKPHVVGDLGELDKDSATNMITNTPYLIEIQEAAQWQSIFEPTLGSLKSFLGSLDPTEIKVIGLPSGGFIKVDPTPQDSLFLHPDNPYLTATSLVSLLVKYGGVSRMPMPYLKNLSVGAFSKMAEPEKFVLDTIVEIPVTLQKILGPTLIEALKEASNEDVYVPLLALAGSCCRRMMALHRLGVSMRVDPWIQNFAKSFQPSSPFLQPQAGHTYQTAAQPVMGAKTATVEPIPSVPTEVVEVQNSIIAPQFGDDLEGNYDSEEEEMLGGQDNDGEEGEGREAVESLETSRETKAHEFVSTIRREKFKIGEEGLTSGISEDLAGALDVISYGLYSQEIHFILELIQNSDDNVYSSSIRPTLEFHFDKEQLIVKNNEKGFREKDILALCSVGRSTKKGIAGFIGQKGIGFKSVFRVTDSAEIHSKGFHIKFDTSQGGVGYILPIWIPQPEDSRKSSTSTCTEGQRPSRWNTEIVLPFKREIKDRSDVHKISQLQSNLLLFLQKLRCIRIYDSHSGTRTVKEMSRVDLENNIVELTTRTITWDQRNNTKEEVVTSKMLVHWMKIEKPEVKRVSGSHKYDVDFTELAVAFDMSEAEGQSHYLPQQPVFSYLPANSYGFRFILQADWVMTASRESIDEGQEWNQFLRSKVDALFVHAFSSFKPDGIPGVARYFKFLPIPDECHGFFKAEARSIAKLLHKEECVAVLPLQKDGLDVHWVVPALALTAPSFIYEKISPETLEGILGLWFVHPKFLEKLSRSVMVTLNVKTISSAQVLDIFSASLHGLLDKPADVAEYLVLLYKLMETERQAQRVPSVPEHKLIFSKLRNMRILRSLSLNGESKWVSAASGPVYFSRATGRKNYAFEATLTYVDPQFLSCLDPTSNQMLTKLLSFLGVGTISTSQLLSHVLGVYEAATDAEILSWSPELMQSYLIFVSDHLESSNQENSKKIYEALLSGNTGGAVLMNKPPELGGIVRAGSGVPIHFPGSFPEIEKLFKFLGQPWRVIPEKLGRLPSMRNFFTSLGVTPFFLIKTQTTAYPSQEESPWAQDDQKWITGHNSYSGSINVEDWKCPELEDLLNLVSNRVTLNAPKPGELASEWLKRMKEAGTTSEIFAHLRNTSVLATHSGALYRVRDIIWDKTPASTFNIDGTEITYAEFYRNRFQIEIRDLSQPLFVANAQRTILLIPELCSFPNAVQVPREVWEAFRSIIQHFNLRWEKEYSDATRSFAIVPSSGPFPPKRKEVLSSFGMTLKKHPWWPTTSLLREENQEPRFFLQVPGKDLYLMTKRIQEFIGNGAIYSAVDISPKFAEFLEIRTDVDIWSMMGLLNQWQKTQEGLVTTKNHVMSVYNEILKHTWKDTQKISELFRDFQIKRWIFVPESPTISDTEFVQGHFFATDFVCFGDPVGYYEKCNHMNILDRSYAKKDYTRVFMEFNVKKYPEIEDYLKSMSFFAATNFPFREAVNLISKLLEMWEEKLNFTVSEFQLAVPRFFFPTHTGEWVRCNRDTRDILINDEPDPKVSGVFSETVKFFHPGFLTRENGKSKKHVITLLLAAGFQKFSESRKVSYQVEPGTPNKELTQLIAKLIPAAQVLLKTDMPALYEQKKSEIQTRVQNLHVIETTGVKAVISLREFSHVTAAISCFSEGSLYLLKDECAIPPPLSFFQSLSVALCGTLHEGLANRLFSLLIRREDIEMFLGERGYQGIPEGERWLLPCEREEVVREVEEVDVSKLADTSWRSKIQKKPPGNPEVRTPTLFSVKVLREEEERREGGPLPGQWSAPYAVVNEEPPEDGERGGRTKGGSKNPENAENPEEEEDGGRRGNPSASGPLSSADEALALLHSSFEVGDEQGVARNLQTLLSLPFHCTLSTSSSSSSPGFFLKVKDLMSSDLWRSIKEIPGEVKKIAENCEAVWGQGLGSEEPPEAMVGREGRKEDEEVTERSEGLGEEGRAGRRAEGKKGEREDESNKRHLGGRGGGRGEGGKGIWDDLEAVLEGNSILQLPRKKSGTDSRSTVSEIKFSEFSKMEIDPQIFVGEISEVQKRLGRLGEQFVFQYLKEARGPAGAHVIWENEGQESGRPWDIKVVEREGEEKGNEVVVQRGNVLELVEVKTTNNPNKVTFEISVSELSAASKAPEIYVIFLVYMGPTGVERLLRVDNVWENLNEHNLGLFLSLREKF